MKTLILLFFGLLVSSCVKPGASARSNRRETQYILPHVFHGALPGEKKISILDQLEVSSTTENVSILYKETHTCIFKVYLTDGNSINNYYMEMFYGEPSNHADCAELEAAYEVTHNGLDPENKPDEYAEYAEVPFNMEIVKID